MPSQTTSHDELFLTLLRRFQDEGVQYVLVGGQAVRLNGFLNPAWFEPPSNGEVENIRVADDLIVDLLFAANGHTLEDVRPHIVSLSVDGINVRVLNIDGLLKTKTDYREKDILDKAVLKKLRDAL